jgi:hypothetical protein
MDSKLYLTVAAIVALIFGLGFVLIPGHLVAFYGMTPEPHLVLNIRFFGTTLIALGVIFWFARDFPRMGRRPRRADRRDRGRRARCTGQPLGHDERAAEWARLVINGRLHRAARRRDLLPVDGRAQNGVNEARSSWPKRSVRAREHGPSTLRLRDSSPGLPSPAIQ